MVVKRRNGLLQFATFREKKKLAPSHPRSVIEKVNTRVF
jgi:hypothetical protein